jgi:hypothetical protein
MVHPQGELHTEQYARMGRPNSSFRQHLSAQSFHFVTPAADQEFEGVEMVRLGSHGGLGHHQLRMHRYSSR